MSHIRGFETLGELTKATHVLDELADEQKRLDFESHFVSFTIDVTVFGRVPSRLELMAAEEAGGADNYKALDTCEKIAVLMRERGLLYADHHSIANPAGESGATHKIGCWPISAEAYADAKRVMWNVDLMDGPHMQEVLDAFEKWTENEIARRAE